MSLPRRFMLMAAAISIASAALPSRGVDTAALRRKQDAQERAREMARQMMTGILDVQLQQLEENGLQELPLYREIAGMKKTIGSLVDRDMEKAVEMLIKAQHGSEQDRDEAFKKARGMIREIVMRLAAERQNLMRRLKSAELSALVKRLIDVQSKVWQTTKALPDRPPSEQETIALATIEDQRDVKQLFLQFVDALSEVGQWGGTIGAGAADGLRILQAASVGKELDSAGNLLGALRYADASRSQQLVLKGLRLLQERLEDSQGLLGSDRASALALARELMEKQQVLRDETRKADLVEPAAERLVERQAAIRKELNKLGQALGSLPAAEPLFEQAKSAAYEATGRLFDARQEEALAEQGKVLGNLAEIAEQLASAADASHSDKSASELERQVNDLERAKADLDGIRKQQAEVDRTAPENASRAARQEQKVTEALAKVDDNRQLPNPVVSRLESAEQAAAAAARALEKGMAKPADGPQRQVLENADRAIERAAAEIEAALDDARRKEAGVKIGELARAAEALERASAAERQIASATRDAANSKGLDAGTARQLSGRQAEIERVANKAAEGIEESAAEAARLARAGAQDAASARKRLEQAAGKPGAASKPAAGEAGRSATAAADKLTQAAAQLRKEIDKVAESLIAESSRQLEKVSPVRSAVDEALASAEAPLSDRIERLRQADRNVREALAAQERAAGRPAAADAMQLENALHDALAAQQTADRAAEQLAQGKSASPLEAITGAQAVAEQSAKLADAASKRPQAQEARTAGRIDPLIESLQKSTRAATRAARAALDGNNPQSNAARDEARQALEEAAQMATAETGAAAASPSGKPDAAAQKQVGETADKAAQLAGDDDPQASQSLAAAEKSSSEAVQEARSGNLAKTAAAQAQTAESLKAAHEQLLAALKKLDRNLKRQLASEGGVAETLAARSAAVDPGALAALRSAQTRSARAADDAVEKSQHAQHQSHKDVERAAAILNARQQRVERDKAIGVAVRRMARDQQQSADEIARQSAELLAAISDPTEPESPSVNAEVGLTATSKGRPDDAAAKRRQTAKRLSKAQRDFASAQRGTGEAAEELSSQSQIANRPLREAMENASNLPVQDLPHPTGAFSKGSQKINPNAPGSEEGPGSTKGEGKGKKEPGSGPASGEKKRGLGTGFVPPSPDATAEMMAGAASAKAAAELAAGGAPKGGEGQSNADSESGADSFPEPGDGGEAANQAASQGQDEGQVEIQGRGSLKAPGEGNSTSTATGGGASKAGQFRLNEQLKQGMPQFTAEAGTAADSRTSTSAPRDSNAAPRALGQETWFTKLPPDLRKAIRAKAQRPPPRSYEEKLQKYFESID